MKKMLAVLFSISVFGAPNDAFAELNTPTLPKSMKVAQAAKDKSYSSPDEARNAAWWYAQEADKAIIEYRYEDVMSLALKSFLASSEYMRWAVAGAVDWSDYEKHDKALKVSLLNLYLELGTRYYDKHDYFHALYALDVAKIHAPDLPLVRFELGLTHFANKDQWKAAVELYEAKRLNRFKMYRQLWDPSEESYYEPSNKAEIEQKADQLLLKMGKSKKYPITLNVETGKSKNSVMVPGIGANIRSSGGKFTDIYLGDDMSSLYSSFESFIEKGNSPLPSINLFDIHKGAYSISVDVESGGIRSIQVKDPGYNVLFIGKYFFIGEPAAKIFNTIDELDRKSYGFERQPINDEYYREILIFSRIGLSFFVGYDGKIASLMIQPPLDD